MSNHRGRRRLWCLRIFLFIVVAVVVIGGLITLASWASLKTSNPTCSIEDFYVPALNKTANFNSTLNNHTLYFDLKLDNTMKEKSIRYANISLTFLYNATIPVANYTVPGFHQRIDKSARHRVVVEVFAGMPWVAARDEVSNGSKARFTARMATRVKFKLIMAYSKWHNLEMSGDVMVNDTGKKDSKKGIRLKSRAPDPGKRWGGFGPGVVVVVVVIWFILLVVCRLYSDTFECGVGGCC